jgi:hypothetical protein
MTSMQIDSRVRDELAKVAESDLGGVALGEAVRQLIMEHHIAHINRRYEELHADPDEWASYTVEARLTDNVAGEGLADAREEYPEYEDITSVSTGRLGDSPLGRAAPGEIAELRQWLSVMVAF